MYHVFFSRDSTDALLLQVHAWVGAVRKALEQRGFWCDGVCPITGHCMYGGFRALLRHTYACTAMAGGNREKQSMLLVCTLLSPVNMSAHGIKFLARIGGFDPKYALVP